ncbi:BREX-3 system P-loop-containing protein BrxF [Latilactobacillus fuchuensis]|uniref:BREX-3 system P-loop-containing protein BrxF n=1 Tax=Latilactobacillus fuchuensis TaxID=164393 RepID=A0A2N9DX40_9LACO|nr:BREX-3 system P-loop-containing protein BrxF [Latilactobacillus fuchuensis]SPC39241.1 conserved hypothetical protein [Latilactobacillus fuchuensis]
MVINVEEILPELVRTISSKYEKLAIIILENKQEITETDYFTYLSINLSLSKLLMSTNKRAWGVYSSEFITNTVKNSDKQIVLIDNFELLMNPELSIDIFELLKQLSKNKVIIITWRYGYKDNSLIYGEPGHNEYRKIELKDETVIV